MHVCMYVWCNCEMVHGKNKWTNWLVYRNIQHVYFLKNNVPFYFEKNFEIQSSTSVVTLKGWQKSIKEWNEWNNTYFRKAMHPFYSSKCFPSSKFTLKAGEVKKWISWYTVKFMYWFFFENDGPILFWQNFSRKIYSGLVKHPILTHYRLIWKMFNSSENTFLYIYEGKTS